MSLTNVDGAPTGTPMASTRFAPTPVPTPAKPTWRGRLHQIAFLASIPLGLALVAVADTASAKVAALVYSLGAIALYGTSAAYHRGNWSERGRAWMQRLDHSMIYVLIAATYTPMCLLALRGGGAVLTLVGVWVGAIVGVFLALTGLGQKRGLGFALYLALGWVAAFSMPGMAAHLGPLKVGLVVAGGLAYTVGAISLATNWPNPRPTTFGYHEVWHALTLVAGACFAVVVWSLVLAA